MKRFLVFSVLLGVVILLMSLTPCQADDLWEQLRTTQTTSMTIDLPYIYILCDTSYWEFGENTTWVAKQPVYRSTDNGATWEHRCDTVTTDPQEILKIISMDLFNPDIVFMSIFIPTGRYSMFLKPLSYNPDRVYRSVDAGSTWALVDFYWCFDSSTGERVSCIVSSPDDSNTVFYGRYLDYDYAKCPVRRSESRGDSSSWELIAEDEDIEKDALCLATDPDDVDILYAGTDGDGVFKTTNATANDPDWDTTGLKSKIVNSIVIDPTNTSILYAGTTDDVYRSADAGTTWTLIAQDSNFIFNSLALNPEDPNILYAVRDYDQVYFYYYDRTDDWIDISDGLASDSIYHLISDVNSPDSIAVYAATDSGVYLHEEEDKEFIRGDAKADDGDADIVDYMFLYYYIYQGGQAPPCMDAADVNDDDDINVTDLTYLSNFIFSSGPAPPRPYGAFPDSCGTDPTSDTLGCLYSPCYGQ